MTLGQTLTPMQRLEQVCSVCRRPRIEEETDDTDVTVALFGKLAYTICPCCRREVRDPREPNYRARARRWIRSQFRDS